MNVYIQFPCPTQLKFSVLRELKLGQVRSVCRCVCRELVWAWDLELWPRQEPSPGLASPCGV